MPHKRQVFFNSNAQGIELLSVAVYSLLKESDPQIPLTVFVAHERTFSAGDCIDRIRGIVSRFPFATVRFLDYTPCQLEYGKVFGSILWAFPLCERLLPADITGNLVYLDIDMLIRKDLGELYDMDLKSAGKIAAAVNESRREHLQYLIDAGWPEAAGYSFNNATTVVDLEAFRRARVTDRIIEWYGRYHDIALKQDQDAQNVIYGADTLRIPPKWNYTDGWLERILKLNPFAREWRVFPPQEILEAILDPCIIHYIGRRKPTSWTHRPERKVYRKVLEELGLLPDGRLPGETWYRRIEGRAFDALHLMLKAYARLLLKIRSRPQ